MNKKEIHIVSFNIPYPPNYGGIIDVFYKIKALSEQGIRINLHCFKYDRPESDELEKYCKSVSYYHRPKSLKFFFSSNPFITNTRASKELFNNLTRDNCPILFEGLHTTFFLPEILKNKNRNIIVRAHNIEHEYYMELAKKEKNLFKRIFFKFESRKLEKYESILKSNITIAAISEKDYNYFKLLNPNTILLPAFHPYNNIDIKSGKGDYILYHGNLSVNENIEAATFIINKIASKLNYKFIIAGRNPDKSISRLVKKRSNIKLIADPDEDHMNDLIQGAHINLLLTKQSTGIKLKLINALHIGRFCIANQEMISGTQLGNLCIIKNQPEDIILEINNLMNESFTESAMVERKQTLLKFVNNTTNAQNLINLLNKI